MIAKLRGLIREDGWIYLSVPALLTAVLSSFIEHLSVKKVALIFAMNVLISIGIGASIKVLYRVFRPLVNPDRRAPLLRWSYHGFVIGAGVALGTELALRTGALIGSELVQFFPRLNVLRIAIPIAIAVVSIALARDKLRAHRLQAQLEALQARTNPHFLFNTLNTVASLIGEDPVRAELAVERLSAIFRYALDGSRAHRVKLSAELEMVDKYLELEKLRFGDRLTAEIVADDAASSLLIPPLILQPLVENAVNHGVGSKRGPGRVEIRARIEGELLILEVEDDGPGPGASRQLGGSGTAQSDLEARLALNYSGRAKLIRGPGKVGYLARIEVPAETA